MRFNLTHMLLAANLVVLVVIALRQDLVPAAHAANGNAVLMHGCRIPYPGADCRWEPIQIDVEGRLVVTRK